MTSPADRTVAAAKAELVGMGFSETDSLQALACTGCNINAAVEWLFDNQAKQQQQHPHNSRQQQQQQQKRKASDPTTQHSHPPNGRPPRSDPSSAYLRPSTSHLLNMSSLPLPSLPPAPSTSPPSLAAAISPASDYVYTGTVKRYNAEKAYGFISCPNCPSNRDVFFHQSNVLDGQQLSEYDEVEFSMVRKQADDGDRYEAVNILATRLHDAGMEGVKWISKTSNKNNRVRQHDGFAFSAPTSPAAFGYSAGRVGRTDSTAEYLSSLPHYGRVESLRGGKHAMLVSLPLLPVEPDRYQLDIRSVLPSSWQQLREGAVVTFMPPDHPSHTPYDVHILPTDSFTALPSNHSRANTFQTTLVLRHPLRCDESRHTEFKSLLSNHYLDDRIAYLVEKNVNAFLNSDGGWLYCGVDDDGVVDGLWCTKRRRDELKRSIDSVMQHMSPPVDPSLYVLDFLPVHLSADSDLRPGDTRLVSLPHLYVLVVSVKAGSSGSVYFTSGRLHEKDEMSGKEKAWLRRDGSVREMTQRMVAERMHAINRHDEQQARDRMKEEILRELRKETLSTTTATTQRGKANRPRLSSAERERKYESIEEDAAAVESGGENEKRIVDTLLTMGVERAMAVQAVRDVYKEGKISGSRGQNLQSIVGQILDRIAEAQYKQKEHERKDHDEAKQQRPVPAQRPQPHTESTPNQPQPSNPHSHNPYAPLATSQRSTLYPALDNNVSQWLNIPPSPVSLVPSAFASTSAAHSSLSSLSSADLYASPSSSPQPSLYPTVSFAFRPSGVASSSASSSHAAGGQLSIASSSFYPSVPSEAADSVPCDICHASFPFDYYADHHKVCARNTTATARSSGQPHQPSR